MTGPRLAMLALAVLLTATGPASANWLTRVLEHAGDTGRVAARGAHALEHDLGHALSQIKMLPERPGIQALAAEAGHEGHWRFVNAKGETFTAANADELARMRDSLLPGSTDKLVLYLTPQTVTAQRAALGDLPADAELFVATRSSAYRLMREGSAGSENLFAAIKPNLRARLDSEDLLSETLFQLSQPLKPASLRIIALETGSADALTAVPRFDPATRMALIDKIDPARLSSSFARVKGQTVILTGRIEAGSLSFIDAGGGNGTLQLDAVRAAARDADVNLIIVKADNPRQPGGKNWLWQTATIPGLDTAVKQSNFGDFLAAIGPANGTLTIAARRDGAGRVVLEAVPSQAASAPLTETLTDWVDSLAGEATGRIATAGFEADLRDENRQTELDRRIVPGIPSSIQISYLVAIALGFFGLGTGWSWWSRIWPAEDRADYRSYSGYALARFARGLMFLLLFLPVVGLPLFLRYIALQVWALATAPVRAMRWMRDRLAPGSA
jgi:hypothetical protein